MEYEYNAIGYNTLYNEVISIINKLKSINVDISRYSVMIDEIDKKLENDINDRLSLKSNNLNDENSNVFNFGVENIYIPYMKILNNIKKSLECYNFIFVIYNVCNYINCGIDNVDINTLVDNCIECLSFVNNVNIIDYNDIYNHINNFYNVVYLVIKKEILLNGNSKVLDYLLSYNTHISNLDSIIKKDIEDNNLLDVDKIKFKCSELYSKGLNSSYVDIDLLKLIVVEENKDILIEENIKDIRDTYNKFLGNNTKLDNDKNDLDEDDVFESKECFKEARNELLKKGIPLGLVGSLVLYGGLGWLPNARFLKENRYTYSSKKTTYVDGKLDSVDENNIVSYEILDDRVITIYDYEPWIQGCNRNYYRYYKEYIYDIPSYEEIDINNLFNMDLSIYNDTVRTNTEESYDFVIDCDKKVVIEENNKLSEELVREDATFLFIQVFYFFTMFMLDLAIVSDNGKRGRNYYFLFGEMFILIVTFISSGVEYFDDNRKYKEKLNKIIDEIKSNELLRSKFNTLYHEFVSKYGEIEELKNMYDKVNNIKYDDILVKKKRLVK